jgi:murein DD-endopeptidase MepM/ murein hydrolase activator NlpD
VNMSQIRYYFDTQTSQYKRVQPSKSDFAVNVAGIFFLSTAIALAMMLVYNAKFESPREMRLSNEVKEMEFYYEELSKKVDGLNVALASVEKRDDNIYRRVLGSEPIEHSIREGGSGGHDRYAELRERKLVNTKFIVNLNEKVDKIRRKLYIESTSQDELAQLTEHKEKLYSSIPAIQPIANKQLIAIASGFGMRIHPVYKVIRMHTGIDFAADTGTPIYATADGKVAAVDIKFDGYGKMVIIDHGYGYMTRYGHMQEFIVKPGQKVKRGEKIGYVGNTGLSTAPHLHYEVLTNGELIDPVHYFFNDLTPAEYEKVVELASIQNQSLGN